MPIPAEEDIVRAICTDKWDGMRDRWFVDITKELIQVIDEIYESPLTEAARDLLNRELRTGINDEKLVALVLSLDEEDRLCIPKDDVEAREPKIICSLGIRKDDG